MGRPPEGAAHDWLRHLHPPGSGSGLRGGGALYLPVAAAVVWRQLFFPTGLPHGRIIPEAEH